MSETPKDERRYWLDEPRNVAKIFLGLVAICVVLLVADFFYDKHAKFAIEAVFGFYGIFGFVCCIFLVLAAKELRKLLKRPEDYYDR
jgi:uncharacterized membrane protein